MSEKIPTTNPENDQPKQYLIPALGKVVMGAVNFDKRRIEVSRRAEGPDMMITHVEVSYEIEDDEGNPVTITTMVSDHHFTEFGQQALQERYDQASPHNIEGNRDERQ